MRHSLSGMSEEPRLRAGTTMSRKAKIRRHSSMVMGKGQMLSCPANRKASLVGCPTGVVEVDFPPLSTSCNPEKQRNSTRVFGVDLFQLLRKERARAGLSETPRGVGFSTGDGTDDMSIPNVVITTVQYLLDSEGTNAQPFSHFPN